MPQKSAITFLADSKLIKERKSDHSYSITFETGEYEKENVLKVFSLPDDDVVYKVTVEVYGE